MLKLRHINVPFDFTVWIHVLNCSLIGVTCQFGTDETAFIHRYEIVTFALIHTEKYT